MKTKKEIEELLEALRAEDVGSVNALGFEDVEWSNPNAVGSAIETLEWVLEKED